MDVISTQNEFTYFIIAVSRSKLSSVEQRLLLAFENFFCVNDNVINRVSCDLICDLVKLHYIQGTTSCAVVYCTL